MTWKEFVFFLRNDEDAIVIKPMYVDLVDDLIAGLLLSQIVYWHMPSKETGKKRCGDYLIKKREDWWNEIRITARQVDRAMKILKDRNLITVEVKKSALYDGNPVHHIKLNYDVFITSLNNLMKSEEMDEEKEGSGGNSKLPNGENGLRNGENASPNGENINTKITTKTTSENIRPAPAVREENNLHQAIVKTFFSGYPEIYNESFAFTGKEQGSVKNLVREIQKQYKTREEQFVITKNKCDYLRQIAEKRNRYQNWKFLPSQLLLHWNDLFEGCIIDDGGGHDFDVNERLTDWERIEREIRKEAS